MIPSEAMDVDLDSVSTLRVLHWQRKIETPWKYLLCGVQEKRWTRSLVKNAQNHSSIYNEENYALFQGKLSIAWGISFVLPVPLSVCEGKESSSPKDLYPQDPLLEVSI